MGKFLRDNIPDPASYFKSEGVKLKGPPTAKWLTGPCDFHGSKATMRVNTATGAFVCMAGCGARGGDVLAYHMAAHGMDFVDAAKALGAWQEDGKPHRPQRAKPLPASAAIQVLGFESLLTYVAAGNIANGVQLTDNDRARLLVASQRIQKISEAFA